MGNACSTPVSKFVVDEKEGKSSEHDDRKASRAIDQQNQRDYEKEKVALKLLLLGPGESGKSTVLKQMHFIYGAGFSERKRDAFKEQIFDNVFESICTLVAQVTRLL